MKILYITAETPWGRGEPFILEELLELNKYKNADLTVIPRTPSREFFHTEGIDILQKAIWLPLFSLRFLSPVIKSFFCNKFWSILKLILFKSRTFVMSIKNLAVVPKAVYVANYVTKHNIKHIHVHWGSTTATIGYVVAELTGIPWSFTLHRWDITENNLLKQKVDSAQFVRCISIIGRDELLAIVGDEYKGKIHLIHMGVNVSSEVSYLQDVKQGEFTIVCPANIIPVKGHEYLIKACSILRKQGAEFHCLIIGDGLLEDKLKTEIDNMDLGDYIHFTGRMPHHELMDMYQQGNVDVVVLPSINTDDGEHEGIPVALMEAMVYGIPVISTKTGGIPELLDNGAGILVYEKSAKELADAIETLINDALLKRQIGVQGRLRIERDFNLEQNTNSLLKLMEMQVEEQ